MARITVEDCLDNLENRFELVLVASKRARQLAKGSQAHLEWENDKPTVMALREISENLVDASVLNEADVPVVEEELESEEMTAATMSSGAESEVGALAAQAEQGAAATGNKADGEIDVAAALAAALAADLGASMGLGATDSSNTDTAAGDDTTES